MLLLCFYYVDVVAVNNIAVVVTVVVDMVVVIDVFVEIVVT